MKIDDEAFFKYLKEYLCVYMPRLRRMSKATIKTYKTSLKGFVDYLRTSLNIPLTRIGFKDCTRDNTYGYMNLLKDRGCTNSTLNLRLCAIKSFLKYCAEQDVSLTERYMDVASIHAFKSERDPRVEYLTQDELALLFSAPDMKTRLGRRDRFFLILMYETGARMQEMLDLQVGDIEADGVYTTVCIHGKGPKVRYVPIMELINEHLKAYMAEFHPEKDSDSWLFYTRHNGEQTKMSPGTVDHFLKKYAQIASKSDPTFPKNLHAHMLRHSVAMNMYKQGIPISYIRDFLGHVSINTTTIYSHADPEMIRETLVGINQDRPSPPKKWKSDEETLLQFCGLK